MSSRAALIVLVLLLPLRANARPPRPRFEPTDLELEEPGVVEADLQVGVIQGQHLLRVVVPDFELDFGMLPNVELDFDWTYAVEQPFDHSVPDNIWLSTKIGLLDARNEATGTAWALGLQIGPRFAAAPGASGAGFEALVLVGRATRRGHLVLNLGGVADPVIDGRYRPLGLETGLDFSLDLDQRGRLSFVGAVAAVLVLSPDPHQLSLNAGLAWSPREDIQLSVIGLVGFLAGSDRGGVLVGYSQKLRNPRAKR